VGAEVHARRARGWLKEDFSFELGAAALGFARGERSCGCGAAMAMLGFARGGLDVGLFGTLGLHSGVRQLTADGRRSTVDGPTADGPTADRPAAN